jgi:hypothetical protein
VRILRIDTLAISKGMLDEDSVAVSVVVTSASLGRIQLNQDHIASCGRTDKRTGRSQ